MSIKLILGDALTELRRLPSETVHCVVTSPPYFGLRDYGVAGQIGLEPTPAEFVAVMVEVFREVRRVLRDDGTLWLNLGDSYATPNGGFAPNAPSNLAGSKQASTHPHATKAIRDGIEYGLRPKNLLGIPWRVAFALQADGWYLRQDIIWSKPNPMPESVTDRCTKAHEYLFLLSKSARYHYDADAVRENSPEFLSTTGKPAPRFKSGGAMPSERNNGVYRSNDLGQNGHAYSSDNTRNRRSVWTVATQPFKEAHFATFPPDLIEPCILAGCPKDCCAKCGAPVVRETEISYTDANRGMAGNQRKEVTDPRVMHAGRENDKRMNKNVATLGWSPSCTCDAGLARGVVLDPFGGAGTTGLVADRLQRDAILIELNPAYAALANGRILDDAPLFATVTQE